MATADNYPSVTIIGAGVVGICCALSLLEKGVKVKILGTDPLTQSASHGNAGVISPWSCIPQSMPGVWKSIPKWLLDPEGPASVRVRYLLKLMPWAMEFLKASSPHRVIETVEGMAKLNLNAIDLYRHHLKGSGQEHLLQDSWYLHIYEDASAADLKDWAWQLRVDQGATVELISGDELREIEPDLSERYNAAIVIKEQARALSPGQLCITLTDKIQKLGGEFICAMASEIRPTHDAGWSVTTVNGEIKSDLVIIAAGAWSGRLLAPLNVRMPLEPERGYHLMFRDPGVSLTHSIMETGGKFVTSLMDTGIRSAGTAEFAGLDAPPDYRRAQMLKHMTKRMLPSLNTDDTAEWMGVRPSMPDSLPCIGRIPGHEGLLAAFGHSHYGLSMAPETGRSIADLVVGSTPSIDLNPYRIDRFG